MVIQDEREQHTCGPRGVHEQHQLHKEVNDSRHSHWLRQWDPMVSRHDTDQVSLQHT